MTEPSFFVSEQHLVERLVDAFNIEIGDSGTIDAYDVFVTVRDELKPKCPKDHPFLRFVKSMQQRAYLDVFEEDNFLAFVAACHYYFGA